MINQKLFPYDIKISVMVGNNPSLARTKRVFESAHLMSVHKWTKSEVLVMQKLRMENKI